MLPAESERLAQDIVRLEQLAWAGSRLIRAMNELKTE